MTKKRSVLVLDDDEINLMILIKGVESAGFLPRPFTDAESAWAYMQANPNAFDIALLDKMMPGVDGMELLRRMKADPQLRHILVIMQTGDVGVVQMRQGLEAGAYYYLTKPFHPEILVALLHSCGNECMMREEMLQQLDSSRSSLRLLAEGEFLLSTHAEARNLCATIAQLSNAPEQVAGGLMELLSNAIEHGNLAIGYAQKRAWLLGGVWEERLQAHANKPDYAGRKVRLHFSQEEDVIKVVVRDEGAGFDWRTYLTDEKNLLKLNEPNGRGIAKAFNALSKVQYVGNGNEVYCSVPKAHTGQSEASGAAA